MVSKEKKRKKKVKEKEKKNALNSKVCVGNSFARSNSNTLVSFLLLATKCGAWKQAFWAPRTIEKKKKRIEKKKKIHQKEQKKNFFLKKRFWILDHLH